MLCVEYKCYDDRDYFDFWTDCGCFIHCISGKKIYGSLGEDINVNAGSTFYLKKGAYTGKNIHGDQYCALMFFMPDSFFQDFLTKYPHLKVKELDCVETGQIISIAPDQLLEAYFGSVMQYFATTVSKEILGLKMDELAVNLFTNPKHFEIASYLSSLSNDRSTSLRQIVEQNFSSNLKLEELAALCAMSLSSFKREFSRIYNDSPAKWMLKRKLKLSKNLLMTTDKSINEIAFQCGFEDTSHFIRVFKDMFSETPLKFREGQEVS